MLRDTLKGRFFAGFNDAAVAHILGSIPLLVDCAERCDADSVVLQAGGCYGLYPLILAPFFRSVITFEPDPFNFRFLERNLEKCNTVLTLNAALGVKDGEAYVHRYPSNPGGSCIQPEGRHLVEVCQGDRLFLQFPEMRIGMIQLDVEGRELEVLQGLEGVIHRDRPLLMYEHCHDPEGRVADYLSSLRYQCLEMSATDAVWRHSASAVDQPA